MPERPLSNLGIAFGRLLRRLVPACLALALVGWSFSAVPALAQKITGTPGAPNATTTVPGNQLPAPAPPFCGVIKDGALQSKPWWAPRITPPASAPNVLLIITDDAGFGVPSTFGGVIPTPAMEAWPRPGCGTTACSPRRCAPPPAPP
jgi:arylsulfatase